MRAGWRCCSLAAALYSREFFELSKERLNRGGIELTDIDFRQIIDTLFDEMRVRDSLGEIGIHAPLDILQSYSAQLSEMASWLQYSEINLDRNLRLEYLAGAALDRRVEDSIFSRMIADINYPDNLVHMIPGDDKRYRHWFEKHFDASSR